MVPVIMAFLVALLLTVVLGPPFGNAGATALELGPPFTVEVTVEVGETMNAVLLRPVTSGGELDPVAMVNQGDGTWVGILSMGVSQDILVAFEAIDPDGTSSKISELHSLTELGVDPAVFGAGTATTTTNEPGRTFPPGIGWLIVGGVLAIGALLLLAIWAESAKGEDGG